MPNPLAHLPEDELVARHANRPADNHFLSEMMRRHGKKMVWLTVALVVLTVFIVLLTAVLVWLEVGITLGHSEKELQVLLHPALAGVTTT